MKRVGLQVPAEHAAARKLCEKFGFRIEGTHRQAWFKDGALRDALTMALWADDGRSRKP